MDLLKMLAELRADRELIEEAIIVLERFVRGGAKRRGRPPKWMSGQDSAGPRRLGRPPGLKMSAAARKAQSGRMKQYRGERRKKKSTNHRANKPNPASSTS